MEDVDRARLLRHRVYFVKNVDARRLYTSLQQEDVLTSDDCEIIEREGRTFKERAEMLLDTLTRKGPRAFSSLCRALRPTYRFVLNNLGLSADELRALDVENEGRRSV